jgi:hypothetical protein
MKLTVLGAGTAGLVAALVIKKTFPLYEVNVIESDTVGIIGVGEGSTEHWKMFADYCDFSITDLVREADAALKKGIKFENWNGDGNSYFHSLSPPFFSDFGEKAVNLAPFSQTLISKGIETYDPMMNTNLIDIRGGVHTTNQYHFNTFKLNEFLHNLCSKREISIIKDTIVDVKLKENGDVESLVGTGGFAYTSDFFVDSSGMKRVISSKLGVKWVSYGKYLPMNHALAFPTDDISEIKPYTLSRALGNGWNWRISTQNRYGNGYVFCDHFTDSTKAHDEVQAVYSEKVNVAKDIKFDAGRVDKFWVNNCISIGLSASFVEPLEASSIGNTILQSFGFVNMLPYWEVDRKVTKLYDKKFIACFDNIVDFVQLHYITKRDDTEFWRNLKHNMEHTDFLKEHLEIFKKSMPTQGYFAAEYMMFNAPNWAQVMDGLGLFDREYLAVKLAERYDEKFVMQQVEKYNDFLGDTQKNSWIDHKVLLEQNRYVVKLV